METADPLPPALPPPLPPPSPPSPPHAAPARPVRAGLGLLLPLGIVAALLLVVLVAVLAAARWALVTESGSRWLLQRLPMVQVQGFGGALLGGQWRADRLRVEWAGGRQWLLIEGLSAEGLRWTWRPNPQAWVGLDADRVVARKLTVHTGPPSGQPFVMPRQLTPPLLLQVGQVLVDELDIQGLERLTKLAATGLVLDPQPGASHRVQRVTGEGYGVQVDLQASVGNSAPLPLQAQASLQPVLAQAGLEPVPGQAAPPLAAEHTRLRPGAAAAQARWAASLQASGNASAFDLRGTLRGVAAAGRAAPSVDLQARVLPLQAWPLAGLDLQTQALDLQALTPKAPATRIAGSAQLGGGAAGAPLAVSVQLDNTLPGRWNEGRLPLRSLRLQAAGSLQQPDRVELQQFELALADAAQTAGRWRGKALWQGHELQLDTQLEAITPQRLDGRAAAMTLTGPVSLTLRGLPSPDFRAPAMAAAPSGGMSPSVDWKIALDGKLDAAPQPVKLLLEGSADDNRLDIRTARAQAGDAVADLKLLLTRQSPGASAGSRRAAPTARPWTLTTTGQVTAFDPLPWWPGNAGTAWRKGPHRLSGDWTFELQLPPDADRLASAGGVGTAGTAGTAGTTASAGGFGSLVIAQRVAGNGALRLHDSMLAGVPLSAELRLGYTQAAAPAPGSLRADIQLGGNHIVFEGHGDPAGNGDSDHWRADIKADALATLAPLLRLSPALAAWAPAQGAASANITADGRWPALRTEGTVTVSQLLLGAGGKSPAGVPPSQLGLQSGNASWKLDLRGSVPLALQADVNGLAWGPQRADSLHAQLRGTLAEHRLDISGDLPLAPPAAVEQLLGLQLRNGTRGQLQAQGAWVADAAGGGRWRARIERLLVGAWDDKAPAAGSAAPPSWAEAHDLQAELEFDAEHRLVAAQADPGTLRLANTVTLRWQQVQVDLRGAQAQLQLRADIEPFAVAPLLARAQPAQSWQGDLTLAARLEVRAAERVDVDLLVERRNGDLHFNTGEGTQLMGLTELRLAVSAHDGVWNFRPTLRGRSVGEVSGQVRVQSTPEQRWPAADAPVEGKLLARVADISIWSAWVPPGWRLTGEVNGNAGVSGRFGAPQYSGEVTGSRLGVRNLLQGVNVSDGQFAVRLAGDGAQIERFTLRGGDGLLTITGNAVLDAKPQARLLLTAERFRVLGRVDRSVIASGNVELQLQQDLIQANGKLVVDEGLFDLSRSSAPTLDDDVSVRQVEDPDETAGAQEPPKTRRNVVLGLDVDLGSDLRVRGYGANALLRGQLRLTTPGGRLAVNGTLRTEGGTYAAYGQKLEIERGVLVFTGSLANPRLDLLALRPNIDTRVGVAIFGALPTIRVQLYSVPEMSDTDKLSWLVLGRAPDGLGRNDTALLQRAAVALLSGEGEGPTDTLLRNLGLDEISLRQGDGEVRETVVSLGKQLSSRWYLGYERSVNATTGTWQLIYRVAQRFTLRAQSGAENALDVIWTWRKQPSPADAPVRKSTVVPR